MSGDRLQELEPYYAAVAAGELEPDAPLLDAADWWRAITSAERAYWLGIAAARCAEPFSAASSGRAELEAVAAVAAWRAFCGERYARARGAYLALTASERAGDVARVAMFMVARFPELSLSSARFLAARFRLEGAGELELGDVAAGDADPVDFCFWCPRCGEPRDACSCDGGEG